MNPVVEGLSFIIKCEKTDSLTECQLDGPDLQYRGIAGLGTSGRQSLTLVVLGEVLSDSANFWEVTRSW